MLNIFFVRDTYPTCNLNVLSSKNYFLCRWLSEYFFVLLVTEIILNPADHVYHSFKIFFLSECPSFKDFVHHNTCLYVHVFILVVPVSLKCDWNAVPPVRIYVTQSIPHNFDDTLSQHMGLLVKMHVVLSRVVETTSLYAQNTKVIL